MDKTRFSGVQRLFGSAGFERLRRAHVCVIGVGGVGSWAVEALARSGVGALTLVDLDDLCLSNFNRQIHAVDSEVGRPKVEAMARRVREINPDCAVSSRHAYLTASTAGALLGVEYDHVLDAIDSLANKCLLIAECRRRGLPLMVVGGAGGRQQATSLKVADLAFSTHDRLLQQVRARLRKEHGFPKEDEPFGVDCIFSAARMVYPRADGSVCGTREPGTTLRLDCESGYGTACFVTGAFGFAAAGEIVRRLAAGGAGLRTQAGRTT